MQSKQQPRQPLPYFTPGHPNVLPVAAPVLHLAPRAGVPTFQPDNFTGHGA